MQEIKISINQAVQAAVEEELGNAQTYVTAAPTSYIASHVATMGQISEDENEDEDETNEGVVPTKSWLKNLIQEEVDDWFYPDAEVIKEKANKITEGEGWETYRQSHREETDAGGHGDPSDPSSIGKERVGARVGAHSTTDATDERIKIEQAIKRFDALERLVKNMDLSDDDRGFFMDMKQNIELGIGPDYFDRQQARDILSRNKDPDWKLFESKAARRKSTRGK